MTRSAVVIAAVMSPRAREFYRRGACADNLKRLGQAMAFYVTPESADEGLKGLVQSGIISPKPLICPSSGLSGGNYVVVGRPPMPFDNRMVVLYEPRSNHGDGGSFLFADGHVSFVTGPQYDLLVSKPHSWWKKDEGSGQ